jgi:MFS transporter, DHA1 family, multidrug resistance protein
MGPGFRREGRRRMGSSGGSAAPRVGRLVPRAQRGTVYGITASAMFLGNSLGPLSGGAVAAAFGLRWVFLVTAAVLFANLLWVYYRVPEYVDRKD